MIELVIGIIAGTIVLLAAGGVLAIGNRYWDRAWDKINLQREASHTMHSMTRSIRTGTSAELDKDGKGLKIHRDTDWIRYFLDMDNNLLKCQLEGQAVPTVVGSDIADISFTLDSNKVDIGLKLRKDEFQNHFVSTVMMRNYGG